MPPEQNALKITGDELLPLSKATMLILVWFLHRYNSNHALEQIQSKPIPF